MLTEIRNFVREGEFNQYPLPKAMAVRMWVESERTDIRFRQILGQTPAPTPLLVTQARITLSTPIIEEILNSPETAQQNYLRLFKLSLIQNVDERLRQGEDSKALEDLFDLDSFSASVADSAEGNLVPLVERNFRSTIELKEQVVKLAQENGVGPQMVYLRDDLYEEAVRRTFSRKILPPE